MTDRIALDDLPSLNRDARRDRWGRYLICPPGCTKPVGYTRVTTVAKTLDSGGGLAAWKATMAACGLIMRPGLRAQWEALLAEHGGNPWYAGDEPKAACKRLIEECAAAGGANDRREIGTSLHTITALVDLGRSPAHLSPETERDVAAYQAGLAAAGIEILTDCIELSVVLDTWKVAGTCDRLVRVPGYQKPMIADLKTGTDLSYSWPSIAVQLAAYSRANAIYEQGAAEDGSQDVRAPMPDVDQENALIMWLNAGSERLELFVVDLVAGWDAFTHSMWVRNWRNLQVAQPLAGLPTAQESDDLVPLLEASLTAVSASPETEVIDVYQDEDSPQARAASYIDEVRRWLAGRITQISHYHAAATDLRGSWPGDLPTLRSSEDHTPEQLAVIEQLLDGVERRHRLPFPPDRPKTDDMGTLLYMFPGSIITNANTQNTKDSAS
jgi:hypothetical protein